MPPKGREQTAGTNVPDDAFDEPPSRLALPKAHLSISQVNMFLRCPTQYKFRYVDDHMRPPGVATALGSGGHAALEVTHHHLVDHDIPAPTEQLLDCFSDKFKEISQTIEDWEEEKPGTIKDKGIALVRMYNEKMAPTVKPQVDAHGSRGIEKKFELTVSGVPMLGYIDLIDANADIAMSHEELKQIQAIMGPKWVAEDLRTAIADFKFVGKTMAQSMVDGSLQLTMYSLATGIAAVRFDQMIKTKIPKVKRATSIRTRQDHAWLKRVIREVAEAISKGVFPPTDPTNWVCSEKWCGYWHMCRGKKV
jgi:CRISPR/Cas system-associated exonuclease Cas4 (RecB family)